MPRSNLFAGRKLPFILPASELLRCDTCRLGFRWPQPGKRELDELYAAGSPTGWAGSVSHRTDWRLAAAGVAARPGTASDVLDVGCFDGEFLASLPRGGHRAGIEINAEAAQRAATRGIDVIGANFDGLDTVGARYDVVTAFDVIEHVHDPLLLLQQMRSLTRAGGQLMISTGNLDAPTWRLMKSRYWYCAIPEHISFLSAEWFKHAAQRLGLQVAAIERYAHAAAPARQRAFEAASNCAYLLLPRVFGALRDRGYGHVSADLDPAIRTTYPPGWMSARDHVFVTLAVPA